jgi:acyl-CoA thioesterase
MSDDAVFVNDGPRFLPGRHAIGPWAPDKLHGGPVLGLIARALQRALPDPDDHALSLARLSVDMFRPVQAAPLELAVETVRVGSRLALLRATVSGEGGAYAQGTGLFLRSDSGSPTAEPDASASDTPQSPEGLPTESLMRGMAPSSNRPRGFHTMVETRWVPRKPGAPLAIWFRLPIPLIAGEPESPLLSAVALSDFANAVAAIAAAERGAGRAFINADATLYLVRPPRGEWFCLQDAGHDASGAIGIAQSRLYDAQGPLGRVMQARLSVR